MIKEAIVLAGGKGTRLQSVISSVPKPMAPIGQKPFLHYQIQYLINQGIERIVLSVGYKYELIKAYFGDSYLGVPVKYVIEEKALGTGGGIRLALDACESEQVLVCNGDTFFEFQLHKLSFFHHYQQSALSFSVKEIDNDGRYGGMKICKDAIVEGFTPKGEQGRTYINAGVYAIDKAFFMANCPASEVFSFEDDFLAAQVHRQNFLACPFPKAKFIDIGIPEDYEKGQKLIPEWALSDKKQYSTILLDRDGVLNEKIENGYVTRPEELITNKKASTLLQLWQKKGKKLFIVTNQRGVARGLYTEETLAAIHHQLANDLGVHFDGIKYCTAADSSHPNRKPNPGMIQEILTENPAIQKQECLFIGDSLSDLQAAERAGIDAWYILNNRKVSLETLFLADYLTNTLDTLLL